AKRIAIADLRALVEDLGYDHVRTLLNSGSIVFSAGAPREQRGLHALGKEIGGEWVLEAGLSPLAA
ncbi:MAG: DUF1697 domain-containing protein, partial [Gemmatimonadota bacterium]